MFMEQIVIYGQSFFSSKQYYSVKQASTQDIQPNSIITNDNNTVCYISRNYRKLAIDRQINFVARVKKT